MSAETLFDLPAARRSSVGGSAVLAPLLKWPGGKGAELDRILAARPRSYERYFEPFVGGGAVYWSTPAERPAFINDTSLDLVDLYRFAQSRDAALYRCLDGIERWWRSLETFTQERARPLVDGFREHPDVTADVAAELATDTVRSLVDAIVATVPEPWQDLRGDFGRDVLALVPRKLARMRRVEQQRGQSLVATDTWSNIEGAFKACAYTALRRDYNALRLAGRRSPRQAAAFLHLREFSYAAMFRFNAAGEFNVPYGGITYNRKDFAAKIDHLRSGPVVDRLASTTIGSEDFASFLERHQPGPRDWVFLDPPYDSNFSGYDDSRFDRFDHGRLAQVMRSLDCRVQLVIKATPAVREVYADDGWSVLAFDKHYPWTIKQRNDRNATHLLVTNYDPPVRSGR